jgi:hypothetical protein
MKMIINGNGDKISRKILTENGKIGNRMEWNARWENIPISQGV